MESEGGAGLTARGSDGGKGVGAEKVEAGSTTGAAVGIGEGAPEFKFERGSVGIEVGEKGFGKSEGEKGVTGGEAGPAAGIDPFGGFELLVLSIGASFVIDSV